MVALDGGKYTYIHEKTVTQDEITFRVVKGAYNNNLLTDAKPTNTLIE